MHAQRTRTRRAREGRRDGSTVNNSGSKLKFYKIHPVRNHLLFRSRGRATCESTYARRKVENKTAQNCAHWERIGIPHVQTFVWRACTIVRRSMTSSRKLCRILWNSSTFRKIFEKRHPFASNNGEPNFFFNNLYRIPVRITCTKILYLLPGKRTKNGRGQTKHWNITTSWEKLPKKAKNHAKSVTKTVYIVTAHVKLLLWKAFT
jgi:hypothetical protein